MIEIGRPKSWKSRTSIFDACLSVKDSAATEQKLKPQSFSLAGESAATGAFEESLNFSQLIVIAPVAASSPQGVKKDLRFRFCSPPPVFFVERRAPKIRGSLFCFSAFLTKSSPPLVGRAGVAWCAGACGCVRSASSGAADKRATSKAERL